VYPLAQQVGESRGDIAVLFDQTFLLAGIVLQLVPLRGEFVFAGGGHAVERRSVWPGDTVARPSTRAGKRPGTEAVNEPDRQGDSASPVQFQRE
jgi:hypothetical protein